MSIFENTCPQCAARIPAEKLFCDCGYCFDQGRARSSKESLAVLAHEERLYLEYLDARVTQTEADLKAARKRAAMDSNNGAYGAELLLARQAVNTARADRDVQIKKLNALEVRLRTLKNDKHAEKSSGTRVQSSSAATATKPAAHRANKRPAHAAQNIPAARKSSPVIVAKKLAPSVTTPAAAPTVKVPVLATPAPVIAVETTPIAAVPARETPKPAPVPTVPVVSPVPGKSFHATQAMRASLVVADAANAAVAAPPSQSPNKPAGKSCPHCTSLVAQAIETCGCGYRFSSGAAIPSLSISDLDGIKLDDFNFNQSAARR